MMVEVTEDGYIDKAIRIAPIALGGYLLYKIAQSTGVPSKAPSPPLSPQGTFWLVETNPSGDNVTWLGHSTHDSQAKANEVARGLIRDGTPAQVVLA